MKVFSRILLLSGILLLVNMGINTVPVWAEPVPAVLMFDVEGNTQVSGEKILGAISNTKIGSPMDNKAVQLDMEAIMALGYFTDVRVRTEKIFDGVKLIFQVIENPAFKELQITGLTKLKPTELTPYFTQKAGTIFNTATFKEDLAKALKFCQEKKGLYIEPQISDTLISVDGIVRVRLVELKYGKIKILGLEKTKDFVIRRELSIKEGDIIDSNKLREDYMKIMRLRLFDSLDPRFEKSDQPDALDLVLEAKEAQTGTFSMGISYSETSQEMGGLLSYSEANLMGLGQNLALDLNLAESGRNVQFSFYEPWLDEKRTSFGLSLWNSENDMTSTMNTWYSGTPDAKYNLHFIRTGLSFSFGRQFWQDTTARIKFNFEKNDIASFTQDGTSDFPPNTNTPDRPLTFWDNSSQLELTKNKLSYRDRNFVDGGYMLSASYNMAGRYLGGQFDYNKLGLEGKWFHSLAPNLVFGTHLDASVLSGDYPDYDALYLGGMYKLRGYNDQRFSNPVTSSLIGTKYLLSNNELRYRLPANKDFELVLLYDVGQIMDKNNNATIKSDYGIGFRYNIPFLGLIRLDQVWNRENQPNLVFSLGEMF